MAMLKLEGIIYHIPLLLVLLIYIYVYVYIYICKYIYIYIQYICDWVIDLPSLEIRSKVALFSHKGVRHECIEGIRTKAKTRRLQLPKQYQQSTQVHLQHVVLEGQEKHQGIQVLYSWKYYMFKMGSPDLLAKTPYSLLTTNYRQRSTACKFVQR